MKARVAREQPIQFVSQWPEQNDCGVVALAMCLGLNYPQALVLVASVKPTVLTEGVTWRELIRAARKKGVMLRIVRTGIDVTDENVSGILGVRLLEDGKAIEHAVYLEGGRIFDGKTNSIWHADVYLSTFNADVLSLLKRVEQ